MRKEHDALGELVLPDEVYYGVQTQRAMDNFKVSGYTTNDLPEMVRSLAAIKKAAALANRTIGVLESDKADTIVKVCDEIMNSQFADQFPVDLYQGGGGTSFNMNMNEVIANRATEIITGSKGYNAVHPNTHVNLGQSTNDVIPSAMKLTCFKEIGKCLEGLEYLEKSFARQAEKHKNTVKLGRTCLQDALPVTFGQEFSAYRDFVKRNRKYLESFKKECLELTVGGTAVGTEMGTFPGYIENVYKELSQIFGCTIKREENFFDGMSNADFYVRLSAALKSIATGMSKIATDLRIYSSGPRAGFCEIVLPAVQPGSSIMPGKVNPVIPEMVNQIGYQVCGNDMAITMAVEGGELDLNVWEMVISKNLFESFRLISRAALVFASKCIDGIIVNIDKCKNDAESSIALTTVIATINGYEAGSIVAKKAYEKNKSVKQVVLEEKILTESEANEMLDVLDLTAPEKILKIFNAGTRKI